MDLDQLTAFERIVREGSFSRAAWALHIAQPTVSARIQALEQEVGGPLFVRSGRRVTLTALGASFLPYARRALAVLAEGVEAARQSGDGQRGRVSVGVLGSLAGSFLAPALARFYHERPQVECLIRSGDHELIVDLLCDGVVELGLITWPSVDPQLAGLLPLLQLREVVWLVVPVGHPLAGRGAVTQEEIVRADQPLFLLRWWQLPHPAIARLAAQVEQVITVPMETAHHLIAAGVGMGFFPQAQSADLVAAGRGCRVAVADMPPLFRDSALVRLNRSAPPSAAARAFVEALRDRARQLDMLVGGSISEVRGTYSC